MVDVFRRNKVLPAMLAEKGLVSLQTGKWWEGGPEDSAFTGDDARRRRAPRPAR
jgi:hypothetical protein